MNTQKNSHLWPIAMLGIAVGIVPSSAFGVCESINGSSLILSIGKWRTIQGAGDQVYINNMYDGGSGEPSFPRTQEIGFLPNGAGSWNAGFLGSLADSADNDCDNITMNHNVSWYTSSASCAGSPEAGITATFNVNTCALGNARFYAQRTPLIWALSRRPSYWNFLYITRDSPPQTFSETGSNPCVQVSTVSTGCNN